MTADTEEESFIIKAESRQWKETWKSSHIPSSVLLAVSIPPTSFSGRWFSARWWLCFRWPPPWLRECLWWWWWPCFWCLLWWPNSRGAEGWKMDGYEEEEGSCIGGRVKRFEYNDSSSYNPEVGNFIKCSSSFGCPSFLSSEDKRQFTNSQSVSSFQITRRTNDGMIWQKKEKEVNDRKIKLNIAPKDLSS